MRLRSAVLAAGIACALLQPLLARAGTDLPYAGPFLEELREEFFRVEQGRAADPAAHVELDPARMARYRARVERKLRFVLDHVERYEREQGRRSRKKARARAESRDSTIALRYVLELLEAIEAEPDPVRQQKLAADAMTVEYATRSYAEPIASISIPTHLWNIIFDWSLPVGQRAREADREAANLVDPETGAFYTPTELRELIRLGVDLSTLDPPDETVFWKAIPDIASVDIPQHYLGGEIPVLRGHPAVFPPEIGARVQFDGMHLTQSKPKIDVTWQSPECRARPKDARDDCTASYKIKLGMETHADPVANSLLAGIGYNADLAMHLQYLRVDLGDFPYEELAKQWIAYFDQQRLHTYIPLESVLLPGERGHGRDEDGEYVVFHRAVAEYKPEEIERIGLWPFSEGVASTSREARGLQLFNIWIANADMKDEENNKLSLRYDAAGNREIHLTQQDVGHALGLVLPERADVFPWEAFESSWWSRLFGWIRGRQEVNYMNLQQSGLEYLPTWADAKWMARRIAQLTREQIEVAVGLGRFPAPVEALYVEKLVNRRNQIVEVFGIADEYGMLPVDRYLTTADGSVVDGELVEGRFPEESPIRYDGHHADVFGPVFRLIGDGLTQIVQVGVGSVDEIDPGTFEITNELRIAPELVMKLSRRVAPNPAPEGAYDQHIVQDTVRLGFRLGLGNVGFAQGGWSQGLSLAYPVATKHEGLYAQTRLLPLMIWRDVRRGELPDRYVIARERQWHVGARVRSSEDVEVTAGGDLMHDRIFATRTVIDHRDETPLVYHDEPRYWKTTGRAIARLGILDVPFAKANRRSGRFEGAAWRLDPERLDVPSQASPEESVFDRIVRRGDLDEIERIALGPRTDLAIETRDSDGWLGLFLASVQVDGRREHVVERSGAGRAERQEKRVERRTRSTWVFLDNGESHIHEALAWRGVEGDETPESGVRVRWRVDDLNTHSDELDRYYAFLRGLAPGYDFVSPDFVASDWEVSGDPGGRWTHVKVSAQLDLRPEALDALCELDGDRFDETVGDALRLGKEEVARRQARYDVPDPKRRMLARRRRLSREGDVLRTAHQVERRLERACRRSEPLHRLREQGAALFAASRRRGPTYDSSVVGALLGAIDAEKLGKQNALLLEGRIYKPFDEEHNLPERRDLFGRLGDERARLEPTTYRIFPINGVDQWKQLDWLRAERRQ